MKTFITTILLLLSTLAFADDKIVCYLQNGAKIYEGTVKTTTWGGTYITFVDPTTGKLKKIINAPCIIEEP